MVYNLDYDWFIDSKLCISISGLDILYCLGSNWHILYCLGSNEGQNEHAARHSSRGQPTQQLQRVLINGAIYQSNNRLIKLLINQTID